MLNLRKIAVTGGLACGKSTVCRFFEELGAYVVSTDEIVHQLLSPRTTLGQQVIHLIGSDIVVNNQIDRSRIANKVFNQQQLLQDLEKLIHPAVYKELERIYKQLNHKKDIPLFVAEVPLLFETEFKHFFDCSITVIAQRQQCEERFSQAGYNLEEFDKRSSRQLSQEEKARLADYVIENNGSLPQLKSKVKALFHSLTRS